jgi:retron-type reverse transcriptase
MSAIPRRNRNGRHRAFQPSRLQQIHHRSAHPHQALDALNAAIQRKRVNWIVDADIRGFFDQMDQERTMQFVAHRQGAVISPLLANVYLHYVLDLWAEVWRKGT